MESTFRLGLEPFLRNQRREEVAWFSLFKNIQREVERPNDILWATREVSFFGFCRGWLLLSQHAWYHSSILFWPNRILLRGLSGCCFRGRSLLWSLQRACASSHPVVGVINHTLCLRGNHWDPSWICTSSWYDWLPKVLKIWQQKRISSTCLKSKLLELCTPMQR